MDDDKDNDVDDPSHATIDTIRAMVGLRIDDKGGIYLQPPLMDRNYAYFKCVINYTCSFTRTFSEDVVSFSERSTVTLYIHMMHMYIHNQNPQMIIHHLLDVTWQRISQRG